MQQNVNFFQQDDGLCLHKKALHNSTLTLISLLIYMALETSDKTETIVEKVKILNKIQNLINKTTLTIYQK